MVRVVRSKQRPRHLILSLPRAMTAVVLLVSAATFAHGQTQRFCEGEVGQTDWVCDILQPIPPDVFEEFLPLPGIPDPANPATYRQIAGEPAFDEVTGLRNNNSAVFAMTAGTYFCMLAESNGEAVLFDAPEGGFVSSTTPIPTSSWLPESVGALLAEETKLKYIVYTHSHSDHIGAAGLVVNYFAGDEPQVISSRRTRWVLRNKNESDPNTVFGNTRGVPLPEWYQEDVLEVGGLRFVMDRPHIHEAGDYLISLNKTDPVNANAGIATSVVMVVDAIFPGWANFFGLSGAEDVQRFLEGLDQVNAMDFDVLVSGHLSRLGTKEDVQIKVDFFADVLAGAQLGLASISIVDVAAGIGLFDPTNPNAGNSWLLLNERFVRALDICHDYVLDSSARERDWRAELAGVEVTLLSHCVAMVNFAGGG